jgi:ketol-acid reductoisomerase
MYESCSTTAQRGALDWRHKFREAVKPVFEDLYKSVASGAEAKVVIEANSRPDYKERLAVELKELRESELWQTGSVLRKLRPE